MLINTVHKKGGGFKNYVSWYSFQNISLSHLILRASLRMLRDVHIAVIWAARWNFSGLSPRTAACTAFNATFDDSAIRTTPAFFRGGQQERECLVTVTFIPRQQCFRTQRTNGYLKPLLGCWKPETEYQRLNILERTRNEQNAPMQPIPQFLGSLWTEPLVQFVFKLETQSPSRTGIIAHIFHHLKEA